MIFKRFIGLSVLLTLFMPFSLLAASGEYLKRPEVMAFIDEITVRHNLDRNWVTQALSEATYQTSVIKAILPGTKSTRSWKRYREIMVNPTRLNQGVQFWRENRETLQRAEAATGVPAKYIVAIIGVETGYGRIMGNYRLIDALTTLAFDYPRRAEFFRGELEAFFLLCREQGWNPTTIKGSYAGAIGLPQFIPSSYREYAIDFDGDSRIRLFDSPADAIGSVGNYLKVKGWETGKPVALPVTFKSALPETAEWQSPTILPNLSAAQLEPFSPVWRQGEPKNERFALIPLETPKQPNEYWVGFQNFYVITRYNQSSFYAMAVFQLGEELEKQMRQSGR